MSKNPLTPPDHYIEWATDGGADKVEPTTGRKLTGFTVGSNPDFNSEQNYLLNLATRWSKFNSQVNAAEIAWQNIEYTEEAPFGTSINAIHLVYCPNADRWYCTIAPNASNSAIVVYDSPDGRNWSAGKTIVATGVNDQQCTPCWSNGTKVGVAAMDKFYLSTDNTADNIPTVATGTFTNITLVYDLIYDDTHNRWFACGQTGAAQGDIESSADGITWTSELPVASAVRALAGDRNGNAVAMTVSAASNYYSSTMQGGWSTTTTDPDSACYEAAWCPSLGLFAAVGTSASIYFSETGQHWHNTDYDMDGFYVTPDFVMCEGDSGGAGVLYKAYAFTGPALDRTAFNIEEFGYVDVTTDNDWDQDTTYISGQGKVVWIYGVSTFYLAVARYGPDTE